MIDQLVSNIDDVNDGTPLDVPKQGAEQDTYNALSEKFRQYLMAAHNTQPKQIHDNLKDIAQKVVKERLDRNAIVAYVRIKRVDPNSALVSIINDKGTIRWRVELRR